MARMKNGEQDDLPLFARHSDPDTSHQAMREYDRDRMRNAEQFVVSLYVRHGELADFQLKKLFDYSWKQPCSFHLYRQARSIARDHGKIIDTGKKIINPETKRHQVIWAFNDGAPIEIHKCPTCGHVLRRKNGAEWRG
jgi:hypothetical protein